MINKDKALMMLAPVALVIAALAIYMVRMPSFDETRPLVGDLAPDLMIADLSGRMISLSDYRGGVTLVNFWASWCPPCKDELKWFQSLHKELGGSGFNVVAIAIDNVKPAEVRAMGLDFPVAVANERVRDDYGGVGDVPVSFLIGTDGRLIKKVRKVYEEKDLRADVIAAMMQSGQ